MNFLSYAQNFEDVMLHRALRGVECGFYIDVGAQHPTEDSVTRAFYDRGWRGINVDPVPQWAELLRRERPHDTNLQLALGAQGGHKLMFAVADTGLSTDNEAFVQRHREAGYRAESFEVDVSTLDDVCDRHGVSTVHFLKIDVEGAEIDVIRGFSFDRVRPWIVLVEAIEPVTASDSDDSAGSVTSHQSWEPILLAHGYAFVYDDGLNRFYLAHEKSELREHFFLPPNPLDGFMRYQEWIKHERIVQLDSELKALTDVSEMAVLRRKLQTLQDARAVEQREHQHLLLDSANRLQRISVLEQENAALQAAQSCRLAEEARCAADQVRRREEEGYRRAEMERVDRAHAAHVAALEQMALTQRLRQQDLEQELDSIRSRHAAQAELAKQLQSTVQILLQSSSWRITKPLRWLRRKIASPHARARQPIRTRAAGQTASVDASVRRSGVRFAARRALLTLARAGFRYPSVGRLAWRGVALFPQVKSRLVVFINNNYRVAGVPAGSADQSASAHADLPMPVALARESTEVAAVQRRLSAAMARMPSESDDKNPARSGKSSP